MNPINLMNLEEHIGKELGVSEWVEVTQERIDQFAEATDDRQWIHINPERAAKQSPYKATVAHGFLTLSLVSVLLRRGVAISGIRMALNYGLNRVRFVSAVPAGSKIRGRFVLASVEHADGGIQATWSATVEREGGDKPCCVAEWIVRYYPG